VLPVLLQVPAVSGAAAAAAEGPGGAAASGPAESVMSALSGEQLFVSRSEQACLLVQESDGGGSLRSGTRHQRVIREQFVSWSV
jgi:hypothetical protein